MWHDLGEDDLILPAHGNEYVLKGSELFEDSSNSGRHSPWFICILVGVIACALNSLAKHKRNSRGWSSGRQP